MDRLLRLTGQQLNHDAPDPSEKPCLQKADSSYVVFWPPHVHMYTHIKKGNGQKPAAEGVGVAPKEPVLLQPAEPLEC